MLEQEPSLISRQASNGRMKLETRVDLTEDKESSKKSFAGGRPFAIPSPVRECEARDPGGFGRGGFPGGGRFPGAGGSPVVFRAVVISRAADSD